MNLSTMRAQRGATDFAGMDGPSSKAPRCPVMLQQLHGHARCSSAASTSQCSVVGRVGVVGFSHRASEWQERFGASRRRGLKARALHDAPGFGLEKPPRAETLLIPQLLMTEQSQGPSAEDFQEILPLLSPKQLAEAIWSFAKQGHTPTDEFMAVVAQEVHSKLDKFRSQDLSNTIWAFAVLKYHPDDAWWEHFERQVYKNVTDFTGRELSNLLWSLAILDHRPAWILDSVLGHALDNMHSYSANSLQLLIYSLGKLGYQPGSEWLEEFQRASQSSFFQFTPSEMSNVIWGFAKLGAKLPEMWLDNFLMVAQWRFPSFSAKLLSILVWSTAMLDHRPSQEWMLCFEQQVREKFDQFSGQELACVAWALRRFGHTGDSNAVFYMLDRQDGFREADFQILGNGKLLSQVLTWRGSAKGSGSGSSA